MYSLLGMNVIESPELPLHPSDGTIAKRIVRHGLADVLEWLGEEVGPKPEDLTHAFIIGNNIYASVALVSSPHQ